ncbi:hypothetical protein HUU05_24500 [candidate division KSB1 bacterium]|nr:hypothetical protein [candidate division KSB1 bacterium]
MQRTPRLVFWFEMSSDWMHKKAGSYILREKPTRRAPMLVRAQKRLRFASPMMPYKKSFQAFGSASSAKKPSPFCPRIVLIKQMNLIKHPPPPSNPLTKFFWAAAQTF